MSLVPDTSTFAVLPWLKENEITARLICMCNTDGQPFLGDPRAVLTRIMNEAEKMGFIYNTGPELEFFLLRPNSRGEVIPPQPHDSASYFDMPTDMVATDLWRQAAETLSAFGIEAEAMHHEIARASVR